MKKTYLYVTPFFPSPACWRGAVGLDFVKALSATGEYDVHVFKEGAEESYEIDGVKVWTFRALRLPSNVFPFLFQSLNDRCFLDAVRRAGISVSDVSVCHANTANYAPYALALKRQNRLCLSVLQHHDLQSFGLNMGRLRHCWLYNLVQFPILRSYHERIDLHAFISEASRRSFLAAPETSWTDYTDYRRQMRRLPWRAARIRDSVILHNGVDTEIFRPSLKKGSGTFVIGTIANFVELKDYPCAIRALAMAGGRLGDWKWRIVGSGPLGSEIRRMIEDYGFADHVEFLGECSHEKLVEFYQSLDLFVLPSYFEGFGCVFTEAYACGVPFITCRGQGIEDLMDEETQSQWLIEPHAAEALRDIIIRFHDGREGMRLARPYSASEIVVEYAKKIRRMVEARE